MATQTVQAPPSAWLSTATGQLGKAFAQLLWGKDDRSPLPSMRALWLLFGAVCVVFARCWFCWPAVTTS
ncbi:hypothetical protein [Fodinicola feengrottensis]|uniref:hypothetical protein n=1 Tax=Fodinicola feengrottensis TaxID=435914 RepID=UPI0013D27FB9|nr:hypothetical protein [Fodinicola feengrottensis]